VLVERRWHNPDTCATLESDQRQQVESVPVEREIKAKARVRYIMEKAVNEKVKRMYPHNALW